MVDIIKDGTGKAYNAKVDSHNRLGVVATVEQEESYKRNQDHDNYHPYDSATVGSYSAQPLTDIAQYPR